VTTTASNAGIRGTARADWTLMTLGPLLAAVVWLFAGHPVSLQNVFGIAFLSGCALVGFVRRLRPWLALGAIPDGLAILVSRSVRIPLLWTDLGRAGVVEHGGEKALAFELRDPETFAAQLAPGLTRDVLRIVRRELGPGAVDAERPSLADTMRRIREKTGFDLLIPEKKLGRTSAASAAAVIEELVVRTRFHRAVSAQEAAAVRDS
jgi:hypothetical protein